MTTVLCVEDNEAIRFLLLAVLRQAGFEVLAAVDGEQGIDMASLNRPDLVLMDIEMPGISGIEATRRLKAMPETRDIPVIALSAHDDRKRIAEAHEAGCVGYAPKPLKVPAFLETIRDVLAQTGVERSPVADTQRMSKILYVEDNDDNVFMMMSRLRRLGHEVIVAPDGESGIALAHAAAPDLILMDLTLPVIDGWEATKRLKAAPETAGIPVIVLTAHVMPGTRESVAACGADGYVPKPVRMPELTAMIDRFLSTGAAAAKG